MMTAKILGLKRSQLPYRMDGDSVVRLRRGYRHANHLWPRVAEGRLAALSLGMSNLRTFQRASAHVRRLAESRTGRRPPRPDHRTAWRLRSERWRTLCRHLLGRHPRGGEGQVTKRQPRCTECGVIIPADEMGAGWGMCAACVHDAVRSGWEPGGDDE